VRGNFGYDLIRIHVAVVGAPRAAKAFLYSARAESPVGAAGFD